MRFVESNPPRRFQVGERLIEIQDCGRVQLAPDEQVTHVTDSGAEFDVVRKTWGFYATPSLNGRLARFGLRGALVRNPEGRYYILLAERGRIGEFEQYLAEERAEVVTWLDRDEDLRHLEASLRAGGTVSTIACICGATNFEQVFHYTAPPASEVRFAFANRADYRRAVHRCRHCGHFISIHSMDGDALYEAGYVDANYGDAAGIKRAFDRVTSLPADRSDNVGRVRRVLEVCEQSLPADRRPGTLLDLGSGLGVFPFAMMQAGWSCTAVDRDQRLVEHARTLGLDAEQADIGALSLTRQYDLITFNKVIEHAADPPALLASARRWLKPGGLMYVEVPDGERASEHGADREEFTIDHPHVFSLASLAITAAKAGFDCRSVERVHEPSTKFTLRAFLSVPLLK